MDKCKDCDAFKKGDFVLRGQVRHTCTEMFVSLTDKEAESVPEWCLSKEK